MSDIRDHLKRAAGPDEPPVDLEDLHRAARSRHQRRRLAGLALGAAAVFTIGGLAWASSSDGTASQRLRAGIAPTAAPTVNAGDSTSTTETTPVPSTSTSTTATTAPSPTTSAPTTAATTTGPSKTTRPATTALPTTTSTTSVAPPETTAPTAPTTAPSSSELRQIAGTYRGEGLPFERSPDGCAVLAHQLDAVFALSSGEHWTYHADYCGTLQGLLWSGEGTFTFSTPTGDTVTGTFTSRAWLPSKGVPYDLAITGGTGTWVGATGPCHLTNHMRMLPSGMQEQAGDFNCDVRLPTVNLK